MKRVLVLICACCFTIMLYAQEMPLSEQSETPGMLMGVRQGMSMQEAYRILKTRCGEDNVMIEGTSIIIAGGLFDGNHISVGSFDFENKGYETFFSRGYIVFKCADKSHMDLVYISLMEKLEKKYGLKLEHENNSKRIPYIAGTYEVQNIKSASFGLAYVTNKLSEDRYRRIMLAKTHRYIDTYYGKMEEEYKITILLYSCSFVETDDF